MVKTEEIKIGERTYRVTQLPPSKVLVLMASMLKYGAPLLSSCASAATAYKSGGDAQEAAMGSIMGDMSALEPEALVSLVVSLTTNVFSVDKNTLIENPDMFFTEHPGDMLLLAVKAAVFQFRPYLSALQENPGLKKLLAALKSQKG